MEENEDEEVEQEEQEEQKCKKNLWKTHWNAYVHVFSNVYGFEIIDMSTVNIVILYKKRYLHI